MSKIYEFLLCLIWIIWLIFSGSQLDSNKKAMTIQVLLSLSYIWYIKILAGSSFEVALVRFVVFNYGNWDLLKYYAWWFWEKGMWLGVGYWGIWFVNLETHILVEGIHDPSPTLTLRWRICICWNERLTLVFLFI